MVVKFETETPQNLSEKNKTFLPMLKWVKIVFQKKINTWKNVKRCF